MRNSGKMLLLTLLSIGFLNAADVNVTSSVDSNVKVGDVYTREHTIKNNTNSVLVDMVFKMQNQENFTLDSSSLNANDSLTIKNIKLAKSAGKRDETYQLSAKLYDLTDKSIEFQDDFSGSSDWGSDCTIQNEEATATYDSTKGSGVCTKTIDINEDRAYEIKLKAKVEKYKSAGKVANVELSYTDSNGNILSKEYAKTISSSSLEEMNLYIPKAPSGATKLNIKVSTNQDKSVTFDDVEVSSYAINSQEDVNKTSNLTYTIQENNKPRTATACLSGLVWFDNDVDGIQDEDPAEHGIEDVTIHLLEDDTDTGKTTQTDANGTYLFDNLDPDHNYSVKVDLKEEYGSFTYPHRGDDESKDSDVDGYGYSENVYLKAGDTQSFDAGMVCCEHLSWIEIEKYTLDRNGNRVDADSIEEAPKLVVDDNVTWIYVVKNTSKETITDIDVVDDKYDTEIICHKDTLESNGTMECSKTDKVISGEYENRATVTGKGYDNEDVADEDLSHYIGVKTSCIGDFVWLDVNENGIQDSGENGLAGVKVELLDENGNQAVDFYGNKVEANITGSDGRYEFCGLDEGNYTIKVTPPSGYGISPKDQGNDDTKDSDINPTTGVSDTIELKGGESNLDVDGGLTKETQKTSCLGDYIWFDANKNGIQDSNESGIAGAKVELLDQNGNQAVDINGAPVNPIVTTSSGEYKFCNLAEGKYIIKVTPPSGYSISPENQGNDDTKDSDIDPTTGKTTIITLGSGVEDLNWDGGLIPNKNVGGEDRNGTACLGNYMWLDENLNGLQDSNEVGVVGVQVELYDANTNQLIATTRTDNNGKYEFCKLKPGKYKVKFEQPNTYLFTYKDKGDDLKDSDVDKSGWSPVVELEAGEKDMSIDAGIYCECDDYKVNPQNYKKVSGSVSLNSALALLLFIIFATSTLKYKRD